MQERPNYRGVICDLDGTLVDSKLDFGEMRAVIGVPREVGILEHIESLAEPRRSKAMEILHRFEFSGAKEARPIPGVEAFLGRVHRSGLPLGILTRNSREVAEFTMERFRIRPEVLVAREDARPKPSPEGLIKILDRWQLGREEVVFVGDFIFDLETGKNAGVATALFAPDGDPDYAHLATHIFRKYTALEQIIFGGIE